MLPLLAAALSVTINAFTNGRPGAPINYFITVRNSGASDVTALTLNNPIPPNTRFLGEQHPDGSTCSESVTCAIPTLRAGQSMLFQIDVQVERDVPQGTSIVDTVTVADTSATAATTISGLVYQTADVSVAASGPPNALAGVEITYAISVANNGPYDAVNVAVVDAIPPNSTFVSVDQTSGPPFACGGGPAGSRGSAHCSIAAFASGASAAFNVTVRVDPGCASKRITNGVAISSDTPNFIGPVTATANTDVTAVPGSTADLAVMIDAPRSISPGALLVSSFNVINTGPADAMNVTLRYDVPAEALFMAIANPAGTTCSTPAPFTSGSVTCTIPKLANEQRIGFSVSVEVSPKPAVTSIANAVFVATETPDPDTRYNSMTSTVTIDTADLVVTQTADSALVMAGGAIAYTAHIINMGPANAAAVQFTDILPDGATLVSIVPSQGACYQTSCSLGNIANGEGATVTVTINAPSTGGAITNIAFAAATTNDPTMKNNHAATNVMVVVPVKKR